MGMKQDLSSVRGKELNKITVLRLGDDRAVLCQLRTSPLKVTGFTGGFLLEKEVLLPIRYAPQDGANSEFNYGVLLTENFTDRVR